MAIITNINTVISNGPTAATAKNAANGNLVTVGSYIMGYVDVCNLVKTKLQECKNLVAALIADTDASDPSLTTLDTINSDLT